MEKKYFKSYAVFPEHVKRCNFTSDEWNNLWWDQDEEPNKDSEDDLFVNYYNFETLFDTMDPGLINGYTTEKYLLEIYDERAGEIFPLVGRLLEQNPPIFDVNVHGKRHMSDEEIAMCIK